MKKVLFAMILIPAVLFAGSDPRGILELEGYGTNDAVGITAKRTWGDARDREAVPSGEKLFYIKAYGYNGSAVTTNPMASITFNANQAWTSTANGTYLSFLATPNNSTTQAEQVRVGNDGFSYLKIVANLDIAVSTPTAVGQLGVTSAGVLYISTSAATLGSWVKVGAQ